MANEPDPTRALSIRLATDEDCGALTGLMQRSTAYHGAYRAMIDQYPVTAAMVEKGEVWVAELKGVIVGFYRLDVVNADLDLMFVDDLAQGAGFGRALVKHMVDFAERSGLSEVQIVAHPPAAEFYRRVGARDIGVSKAVKADRWDRPILKLAVTG